MAAGIGARRVWEGNADASGRIMNRNPGTGQGSGMDMFPTRAYTTGWYPGARAAVDEGATDWTPYGSRSQHPYIKGPPYSITTAGGHGQGGAGFYQSAVNMWPATPVADYPNGQQAGPMMRLAPSTSAHKGYQTPQMMNPNSVFFSPPVWGLGTRPIYATGRM